MLRYQDTSIRKKLILTVMLTAGSALLLASTTFVIHDVVTVRKAVASRVATLAEIVGLHSSTALLFSDQAVGNETLTTLGAERDVISACLFDFAGHPFASWFADGQSGDCPSLETQESGHHFEGSQLLLTHWIEVDGERTGALQIRWDAREVRERVESSILIGLGVLAITALAAFAIGSRLQRAVTEPLADVVRGSEALAEGNLDARVDCDNRDEIGALAQSFNRMAEGLRGLISQVKANSAAVTRVSESLKHTGDSLSIEARRQESVVEDTVASVSTVSRSIEDVNEHVSQLDESARDTATSLIEMDASIGEVAGHMDGLASAIDVTSSSTVQLNSSIHEIASSMEGLDAATQTTTRSLQDLHASVSRVEGNAEKCRALTENASTEADQGRHSVEETIHAMQELHGSFSELQGVIGSLSRKSESIGEIVQVIEGVAEETSLLSLNAAIIAAQAGEHGKAFSVVASSIKALAERTAVSTREIVGLIQSVQGETRKAVSAMAENSSRVERGVDLSHAAGEGLRKILESSGESATMVKEIVENTAAQSRDLEEVDRAILRVRETVGEIDRAISEHKNASSEIARSIEQMGVLGKEVKRSTEEQSRGSKLITSAMEAVTSMIERILSSTREQAAQSDQIMQALELFRDGTRQNARRAEELGENVAALSERSAELEREVGRFTF